MSDAPFRVHVRVKNNRIAKAIERLGYRSQSEACRGLGISIGTMSEFSTFRLSPLDEGGEWRGKALEFAAALFVEPEYLWPKESRHIRKACASFEATYEGLRRMMGPETSPIRLLEATSGMHAIECALSTLSPAEKRVVTEYALNDRTFADIGQERGRSVERTRQIFYSGIRKLRRALASDASNPSAADVQMRADEV